MEPFEAYKTYMALKRHFNSDYDYFKYNGKVNVKYETFDKKKDKYFYQKLSKKQDITGLIISSLLNSTDGNIWIRDILSQETENNYYKWKKKIESLTYQFKNDINKLDEDFDSNLLVKEGQYPNLLKLYIGGEINIETLIIIDDLLNIFKYWNKNISDNVFWPSIYRKCIKYKPFLQFDSNKYKNIIVDKFRK